MINRLKKAIARKLKENFPDYTIYRTNPAQNIKEPCFIIECVNQSHSDLLTIGFERELIETEYLFSITLLYPRNNALLNDVASRVLLCLKWLYLEDGKPVLTLNRQAHPIDDSSYSFTFNIQREVNLQPGEEIPLMREIQENVGIKDEEEN